MKRINKIIIILLTVIVLLAVLVPFIARSQASKYDLIEAVVGTEDIYRIRNAVVDFYAARTTDGVLLFDAGVDKNGIAHDALLDTIKANRDQVQAVFITHGHGDHISGAPLFTNARIYAGQGDAVRMQGEGGRTRIVPKLFVIIFGAPNVTATDYLEERTEISFADEKVFAIPFPGHTPGSYLYVFRKVLFSGDGFNYMDGKLIISPDIFNEDREGARRIVTELSRLLDGVEINTICTGHGGCTPPESTKKLLDDFIRQYTNPA